MKKFEFGPIQTAWLERLEKFPERQMISYLAEKSLDGSYNACCLGELKICANEHNGIFNHFDKSGSLIDGMNNGIPCRSTLDSSFAELGLKSPTGYSELLINNECSLAGANDNGMTWPEIAAFVRANPEAVFTKSV